MQGAQSLIETQAGASSWCFSAASLRRVVMRGLDRSTAQRRTRATVLVVYREISQRELRNQSGEVMRALDAGESFIVTRNGVGVGELTPLRRRRFVDSTAVVEAFSNAAPIDAKRFRADVDRFASQDTLPRA
jgi:antitoxin (DNA-binding transcriptional repressor) of toxin-antitoxin stability system